MCGKYVGSRLGWFMVRCKKQKTNLLIWLPNRLTLNTATYEWSADSSSYLQARVKHFWLGRISLSHHFLENSLLTLRWGINIFTWCNALLCQSPFDADLCKIQYRTSMLYCVVFCKNLLQKGRKSDRNASPFPYLNPAPQPIISIIPGVRA